MPELKERLNLSPPTGKATSPPIGRTAMGSSQEWQVVISVSRRTVGVMVDSSGGLRKQPDMIESNPGACKIHAHTNDLGHPTRSTAMRGVSARGRPKEESAGQFPVLPVRCVSSLRMQLSCDRVKRRIVLAGTGLWVQSRSESSFVSHRHKQAIRSTS